MVSRKVWSCLQSALLALTCAGLGACALDEPGLPPDATRLASQVLIEQRDAYSSYQKPARLVIRNTDAWEQLWPQLAGSNASAAPAVDFDRDMVLVAAMGLRSTGGYSISVEGVFESTDGIYVRVLESVPGSRCGTTQALTAPVTVVTIPQRDGPVIWLERTRTRSC